MSALNIKRWCWNHLNYNLYLDCVWLKCSISLNYLILTVLVNEFFYLLQMHTHTHTESSHSFRRIETQFRCISHVTVALVRVKEEIQQNSILLLSFPDDRSLLLQKWPCPFEHYFFFSFNKTKYRRVEYALLSHSDQNKYTSFLKKKKMYRRKQNRERVERQNNRRKEFIGFEFHCQRRPYFKCST